MVNRVAGNNSGSGSDSESRSPSRSPTPRLAPTPGHSLEHHDSRSHSPANSIRSRSQSPGSDRGLQIDAGSDRSHSKSPSNSPRSNAPSHKSRSRSRSIVNSHASRSRSGTPNANARSVRGSRSRSRSGSIRSGSGSRHSGSARSRSGSIRSNSGSRKSHSRSRSGSGSARSRSGSVQSQKSAPRRSRSRSRKSRSQSKRSNSGSQRSRSGSRRSHSGSVRSHSGSRKSGSQVRSRSGSLSDSKGGEKRRRNIVSDSGSEGEKAPVKKKKSALIDSDSEEDINKRNTQGDENLNADALFGDADDISTDEDDDDAKGGSDKDGDGEKKGDSDQDSDRRRDSDRRSSGSDDDRRRDDDIPEKEVEPEPEPIPERRIDVQIPRIVADLGKDIHFVKLPNFLSVDTRPFDPDTYEDEIDEEETLDEEGRQRIKLKVSNTIRWREYMDDFGVMVKESNTRMVKWSDGSMSLHLGNEIFDVYKQPLQGDHNHLFIRQGTGLQGQAVFRTKLTFRPHSTESFTHKKMTMSLADRSQKTSGIKILTQVGYDPDADRMLNLKKEEEKLRQAMRQKPNVSKPKRNRETAANLNSSYREEGEHESDDEGAISIAAIKNKYTKKGGNAPAKPGAAIYSSDEEDSDMEARRSKKIDKSKALQDSDEEDDDYDGNSGSESDNDGGRSVRDETREKSVQRGNQIESDEDGE